MQRKSGSNNLGGVAASGLALLAAVLSLHSGTVAAQPAPSVTPAQRAAAGQAAQHGVLLGDLKADAPEFYSVRRGDTLWDISGMFLASPWRWPQLWGMNMDEVRNPHLIYPGQQLVLEKADGRARLRIGGTARRGAPLAADAVPVVRISPTMRYDVLGDNPLPTLKAHLIEPFLAEPLVVDRATFDLAPRIVAAPQQRVLLARGDRAYVRSDETMPLSIGAGQPHDWRAFRQATPLKDPGTGEVLGYEAHYLGRARLVRGEGVVETTVGENRTRADIVPATIDIIAAKEEMRIGDRLLPEPPKQLVSYAPHAPLLPVQDGRIVSVYGSAVVNAAQNQVVAINRGTLDGIESGHVLAILSDGGRIVDKTDPSRPTIRLPDERNGLLMVFRPFERVSYALILQTLSGVKVGDRLVNPN